MPKPHTEQFHANYLTGIRTAMADHGFDSWDQVADWLDTKYATIQKIMNRKQAPTVEQGAQLCLKAGYSANWLFLNIGEMRLDHQVTFNEVMKLVGTKRPGVKIVSKPVSRKATK